MRLWRIYYGDESTFDDSMGGPQDAPTHDVQLIIVHDLDHGRVILRGFDWYWWDYQQLEWNGSDLSGVLDQFMHNPAAGCLKQGRVINTRRYELLIRRAVTDPDFLPKSASSEREVP